MVFCTLISLEFKKGVCNKSCWGQERDPGNEVGDQVGRLVVAGSGRGRLREHWFHNGGRIPGRRETTQ